MSYKSSQHWPFPAGSVMIGMVASLLIGPDSRQWNHLIGPIQVLNSMSPIQSPKTKRKGTGLGLGWLGLQSYRPPPSDPRLDPIDSKSIKVWLKSTSRMSRSGDGRLPDSRSLQRGTRGCQVWFCIKYFYDKSFSPRWFSRGEVEEAVTRIDSNPRLRVGRNNNPEAGGVLLKRGKNSNI